MQPVCQLDHYDSNLRRCQRAKRGARGWVLQEASPSSTQHEQQIPAADVAAAPALPSSQPLKFACRYTECKNKLLAAGRKRHYSEVAERMRLTSSVMAKKRNWRSCAFGSTAPAAPLLAETISAAVPPLRAAVVLRSSGWCVGSLLQAGGRITSTHAGCFWLARRRQAFDQQYAMHKLQQLMQPAVDSLSIVCCYSCPNLASPRPPCWP
jgi:hypothetical protein